MKRCLLLAVFLFAALPAKAQHSAMLTWVASASQAGCVSPCTFGYNVYRGTSAGGEGTTPLNTSPIAALTFTDTTVALGNTYYYVVEAVEISGGLVLDSAKSNEVSCTFPAQPAPPTNLLGSAK